MIFRSVSALFIVILLLSTVGVLANTNSSVPMNSFNVGTSNTSYVIVPLIIIIAVLIIFILMIKWILTSIGNHIKDYFDNANRTMEGNFSSLKGTLIEAIRTLQESNLRSMETLTSNTLKVLSHVIDLKKESGNFITDPKTSKSIFDAFMELEVYKDVEIIIEAISNKTITKIDEALTYCLIRFKNNIDRDLSVLSKIDFISGNLGDIVKNFISSGDFSDYVNVCTNSILSEYWNEKDTDKIRQNAFTRLLLFRRDILKDNSLGLDE